MQCRTGSWLRRAVVLTVMATLASNPVLSDKPVGAGGGKEQDKRGQRGGGNHLERERQLDDEYVRARGDARERATRDQEERHFDGRHRALKHEYYDTEHRAGRCPPGLAKTNYGCLPAGHTRNSARAGRYRARSSLYGLPPRLVLHLRAPPAGQRFMCVASDILLINRNRGGFN
jgi:Ni/Co efflux regulator RcnB